MDSAIWEDELASQRLEDREAEKAMVEARLSALNCNHIDYGTVTTDLGVNSNGHDRGITSPALRDAGLDTNEISKSSPS